MAGGSIRRVRARKHAVTSASVRARGASAAYSSVPERITIAVEK